MEDDLVGRANDVARQGSLARLNEQIAAFPWSDLAQASDGNTALVSAAGARGWVDGLDIDELVEQAVAQAMSGQQASLMSSDISVNVGSDPQRLARLIHEGYALVVAGAEVGQSAINLLLEDLERVFAARASATLLFAVGTSVGPPPVPSDADVLLVQLAGRRSLTVVEPSVLSPHSRAGGGGEVSVVASTIVEPGGVAYLPRGWLGLPSPLDDEVIALTLQIRRMTVIDLIEAIGRRALAWPLLRADVPFEPCGVQRSYAGSVFEGEARRASALGGLTNPDEIDGHVARWRAAIPARAARTMLPSLRWLEGRESDPVTLRAALPGGLMVGHATDSADAVLAAGGSTYTVADHVVEPMARLAAGIALRPEELIPDCPHDRSACRDLLIRELVAHGFAAPVV